ncbi:MAG: hypothetical protein AAFV98_19255 [Chloroflexota bacterium]
MIERFSQRYDMQYKPKYTPQMAFDNIFIGLLAIGIGIGISVFTFAYPLDDGVFIIASGAIAFGILRLIKGVSQVFNR